MSDAAGGSDGGGRPAAVEAVTAREKYRRVMVELVRLRRALDIITNVVGHNSCTDGKTPNGFAVALDGARAAQKRSPISNAASWLDQQQWIGSRVELKNARKLLNDSFEQKE